MIVQRGKFMGAIPRHLAHTLVDRDSWNKYYKPRLRPDDPLRFPSEHAWEMLLEEWNNPERDYPLFIRTGSLYGVARNWFGLERISEILYDDRPLFEEIVETLADVVIASLEKTLGRRCAARGGLDVGGHVLQRRPVDFAQDIQASAWCRTTNASPMY